MDDSQKQTETQQTAGQAAVVTQAKNSLAIPLAIVIGFGLIAAAIFFSGTPTTPSAQVADNDSTKTAEPTTGAVTPVNEDDHILGNPNAPIVIVEYSDFDCPFCKNFHETMNQIMDEYAGDGTVAWVYRHFPLEQLHPSAPFLAESSECVAELGGNEAFWKYADLIFGERGTNEQTNLARLEDFAVTAGVNADAFNACLEDERTRPLVEADFNDGIRAGAKGTPYSVMLVGGQQFVINGAQPYSYVKNALDTLIAQLEA